MRENEFTKDAMRSLLDSPEKKPVRCSKNDQHRHHWIRNRHENLLPDVHVEKKRSCITSGNHIQCFEVLEDVVSSRK